ncbi:tyrosine-protein kinase, partial [Klebsiella pneumoniae]
PIVGKGWARLIGENSGNIDVENMIIPEQKLKENNKAILTVINNNEYTVSIDDTTYHGKVGVQIKEPNLSLLINKIDAQPGDSFKIKYKTRLEAINDLANSFHVEDQGKDTGMLALTLTGDDPSLISVILNKISENYLEQNVSRQAAQDARSLEFLNERLPKVRDDLDRAEDKLNSYRKQKDSVDLSL